MKYLLIITLFYVTLNNPAKAQKAGSTEDLKEQVILQGGVSIGTTVVKKEKIDLGQERILYAKAKYTEERDALILAIHEGELIVIRAREKISLADLPNMLVSVLNLPL